MPSELLDIAPQRVAEVHAHSSDLVVHTPLLSAASLSRELGGQLLLKAENLQRTGSFKLRGALSKLHALDGHCAGVVAASAGNHGQALAFAARARGLPCTVYMPHGAALAKIAATRAFGATVELGGESVEQCIERAHTRAQADRLAFVHPFDDEAVILGQAGVGLELLRDLPSLGEVIVPIGGGGLAGGLAAMVKAERPEVRVIGVQAARCAPFVRGSGQEPAPVAVGTIADGIAVKRPGRLTRPLVERYVDEIVTVEEHWIAEAMVLLIERSKLVVEGAGAVGLAALLSGAAGCARSGATVLVLSGGNVDVRVLSEVTRRHETKVGRRLRLQTRVADRPGGLAALLARVADADANVIEVEHLRDGVDTDVSVAAVELTVETGGAAEAERLLSLLAAASYDVTLLH
ncbi:MAG TPA: pyridoxal-phosphate dependent enzyme [Solirubrobacteraceae bacterium]|jgi:threonine dehydratase|nr:pyridoxal-phosphate dependent enzyme [Solirubrobacteraceae bacterium]